MKKSISLITIILSLISLNSISAQNMPPTNKYKQAEKNSILSLCPFAFATGNFKLAFEQRLGEGATIKVMPSIGLSDESNYYGINNYLGFGVEGMLRYFPMKQAPNGFYGAIYGVYKYAQGEGTNSIYDGSSTVTTNESSSVTAYGGGVCFGGEFNIRNVLFVDFYAGGGPIIPSSNTFYPDEAGVGFFGTSRQLPGFERKIAGHFGFSLGIPLK